MTIGTPDSVRIARQTSMPFMPGQHEVEQHDVRPEVADGGQGPRAVADHGGVEALTPQHDGQHLGQCRVVVDHQYARLHARNIPPPTDSS